MTFQWPACALPEGMGFSMVAQAVPFRVVIIDNYFFYLLELIRPHKKLLNQVQLCLVILLSGSYHLVSLTFSIHVSNI